MLPHGITREAPGTKKAGLFVPERKTAWGSVARRIVAYLMTIVPTKMGA